MGLVCMPIFPIHYFERVEVKKPYEKVCEAFRPVAKNILAFMENLTISD